MERISDRIALDPNPPTGRWSTISGIAGAKVPPHRNGAPKVLAVLPVAPVSRAAPGRQMERLAGQLQNYSNVYI